MQVELVTTPERFAELGAQWDQALSKDELESTWLSHEWLSCWWRAFGSGNRLFLPIIWEADRLRLAMPTLLQKRRFKGLNVSTIAFIENGITPRSFLVGTELKTELVASLLRGLVKSRAKWQIAVLDNIKTECRSCQVLQEAATEAGLRMVVEPARISPYVDLSNGFDEWFENLGRRMRRNARRARRLVSEQGKMEVVKIESPEQLEPHLASCFEISKKSWKGALGKDLGGRPDRRQFYTEFAQLAVARGWGSIWLLKLDGKPIAFELHLRRRHKVLLLATDYDLSFKDLSPGVALRLTVLKQLAADGVKHYDLDGTVYEYKLQWTKLTQPHVNLWLFNRRPTSRLLYWAKRRLVNRASSETEG
jgi:CelD/BcsL family acetyltransferase involved in cellulose biosynthesis